MHEQSHSSRRVWETAARIGAVEAGRNIHERRYRRGLPWYTRRRVKVMPDEASVRQDSLRQDSLRQRVAYRAPGFERSCAQNGRKTHWGKSARAPVKNLLKTTWSLEFNFHSLDGQIDLNLVYGEFDNRHFEFYQYTNFV